MTVHRVFAVGLWLAVTMSATAIVWAGTSTVAADLTDRPAPVVAHRDVVTELQSGSSDAETAPGITAPGAGSSASAPTSPGSGSASGSGSGGSTADPAPQASGPAVAAPGAAAPVAPAPAPPITLPAGPLTAEAPRRPMATYSAPGGVATVACSGVLIELVSASPTDGWAVSVISGGPYYVEVHFIRGGQDTPIWAFCLNQPIRAYGGPPVPRSGFG